MDFTSGLAAARKFIHESTTVQLNEYKVDNRYYNAAYEVENFINTRFDENSTTEDPWELINDPTVTGFKIYFHFDAESGLLADENYVNSALAYLKRIGEIRRYLYLKNFIYALQKLSMQAQWIFREIDGIDEMYVANPHGLIRDHDLKIKTFETVDLKMQRLIAQYREIAYDAYRGVWILPSNLREFSFSLYVYDNRMFSDTSAYAQTYLRTITKSSNGNKISGSDPSILPHSLFDCGKCEFTWDSGKEYFNSVNNNWEGGYVENSLTIKVQKVVMSNLLYFVNKSLIEEYNSSYGRTEGDGLDYTNVQANQQSASMSSDFLGTSTRLHDKQSHNKFLAMMKNHVTQNALIRQVSDSYDALRGSENWKTSLLDGASSIGKNVLNQLATNTAKSVIDIAMSKLSKLYLGNVYGFGTDDIAMAARSGNPLAIAQAKQSSESTTRSLDGGINRKNLGNVND